VVTAREEHVKPDVEGTKIYAGKKNSVIAVEDRPTVSNNNLRQAFDKTPGLLVSEETTPLVSFGNRGLAPDRAQFMQVLKDGVPIHADMFGYPEAYYLPPLQTVDHIDFVRGGAALMYGPQPGGAVNFVTKDPYRDAPLSLIEENTVGSHDFYSNYTALTGTQGPFGYYGYFHHRQSQGFRELNSQYEVYSGGSKFTVDPDPATRWTAHFDLYEERHGEPGGLTRADFDAGSDRTTRPIDHFELERDALGLLYEKDVTDGTRAEVRGYAAYYDRESWRQRGGGFGTLPSGATAGSIDIQRQRFYTAGTEARVRHDHAAFGWEDQTFAGGVLYHHTTSPRDDKRGATGDATDGEHRIDSDRSVDYLSFFFENLFRFGALSVTPGVRLENLWQSLQENHNLDKQAAGRALAEDDEYDLVALAGVGAEVAVTPDVDVYANFAQGYRPKVFAQALPTGAAEVVNEDLQEGRSWQADLGVRGEPVPYLRWDASVFHLEFDDQTGSVTNGGVTSFQNVGDAEHEGIELTLEADAIGAWDTWTGSNHVESLGRLAFFYGAMFLDAEFTGGPNTGKVPQYAPDYVQKGGVEWLWKDKVRVRLGGTFLDDHSGNDNNTEQFFIPSYSVWDLTAEAALCGGWTVFGSVNNVFDEHYFPRVTSAGIDPADGANFTLGARLHW